MNFLTKIFGRCTAMPSLKGTWSDPESGDTLREITNIVFSYVDEKRFEQHAEEIRHFLTKMGKETLQAEVGYEYDGVFYTLNVED